MEIDESSPTKFDHLTYDINLHTEEDPRDRNVYCE